MAFGAAVVALVVGAAEVVFGPAGAVQFVATVELVPFAAPAGGAVEMFADVAFEALANCAGDVTLPGGKSVAFAPEAATAVLFTVCAGTVALAAEALPAEALPAVVLSAVVLSTVMLSAEVLPAVVLTEEAFAKAVPAVGAGASVV